MQKCLLLLPFRHQVRQFWEYTFQCRFDSPPAGWVEDEGPLCTGDENLEKAQTKYLDVSNLRPEYNIYKAVYSLAHALDDLLKCVPGRGPFHRSSCATLENLEPWQVKSVLNTAYSSPVKSARWLTCTPLQLMHYLEKVNFTTLFGDEVSFDESGDATPIYDIMNWAWLSDGRAKVHNVGEVKRSASKREELTISEDKIYWNFESKRVTYISIYFQLFIFFWVAQKHTLTQVIM